MTMHTAIIAALIVVGQYAGIVGQIGNAIVGIDNAISASVGLHRVLAQKPVSPEMAAQTIPGKMVSR